jgi:membrane fusion protein, multidrug efflux system
MNLRINFWIKIVQRLPVKISLDAPPPPSYPLRVGLSLEVTINTSDRSGRTLQAGNPSAKPQSQR